jgi:hypothetical protein
MNNHFLNKKNIMTIWEVINEEEMFKILSDEIKENIYNLFTMDIYNFYDIEVNRCSNLMEINKKYILLILNYIKNTYYQKSLNKTVNKIKIHKEELTKEELTKELITYEDIQNERISQFEKDLLKKQQDFDNFINIKPEIIPNFEEKNLDKPISEMSLMIKEITSKRNYDIEKINSSLNFDINNTNNWLKPQETSIKMEKNNSNENLLKKNVTWGESSEIKSISENSNLFINNLEDTSLILKENTEDKFCLIENEVKEISLKLNKVIEHLKINI